MRKKIYIALVVDISESLRPQSQIINNALKRMIDAIKRVPELSGCEIYFTLVTFTENRYTDMVFVPLDEIDYSKLELRFRGQTNPAPALRFAIGDAIEKTTNWSYSSEECFNPLIFFMTDGEPQPEQYDDDYMNFVKNELPKLILNEKNGHNRFTVVGAGFGDANMEKIRLLSGDFTIKINNERELAEFFAKKIPEIITRYSTTGNCQITPSFDHPVNATL